MEVFFYYMSSFILLRAENEWTELKHTQTRKHMFPWLLEKKFQTK